ncbi:hypothetical protein NO976_01583 [Planktothrix agardhii]|jgi:hypothetical protein|uniref:Uncharacterized protein n=2 Tax=Planktothrix agardhii TaxID=1160 RepID=A0A073CF49_PLAA1|nr:MULTISPECIES: hypothetical protein [Planktothrix]MCF3607545.1 hypothetical protein [Planktothrix agardhii 1033]KEI66542.1 hypothetical protein A19Y_1502 [Planktothrix agardhii NIVA-CYA 126/8]MBG0747727.1 hypothetical protein [Planktothrix agardhii KL2]MCB8751643.1 hypothetical protein [Planktothrix agardhii 1810]MCB8760624.1 hypothetical protein [Planktothrix agardhii 1813]
MNNNNSDSKEYPVPESQEKQLDAIAKLAVLSLTWSLAGLSKENRSSPNPEIATPNIHINLSGLKDGVFPS